MLFFSSVGYILASCTKRLLLRYSVFNDADKSFKETLSNVMTFDDVDAADIHADRQNMSAVST